MIVVQMDDNSREPGSPSRTDSSVQDGGKERVVVAKRGQTPDEEEVNFTGDEEAVYEALCPPSEPSSDGEEVLFDTRDKEKEGSYEER